MYEKIAGYEMKLISTKCATRFQLIDFQPDGNRPRDCLLLYRDLHAVDRKLYKDEFGVTSSLFPATGMSYLSKAYKCFRNNQFGT